MFVPKVHILKFWDTMPIYDEQTSFTESFEQDLVEVNFKKKVKAAVGNIWLSNCLILKISTAAMATNLSKGSEVNPCPIPFRAQKLFVVATKDSLGRQRGRSQVSRIQ